MLDPSLHTTHPSSLRMTLTSIPWMITKARLKSRLDAASHKKGGQ